MSNILSRIQDIATNEGITIGALERKIGASKGVLSRAINNGTDIQAKWLQIIADNYPQYSTRWLLTGEGSMLSVDVPSPFSSSPEKSEKSERSEKSEKSERSEQSEQSESSESSEQSSRMMRIMLEQAKEIGRLQEQVRQLTIEQEKNAARADTASIANAG